jgi:DNA repair protein RecO (recombination protein O)
VALRSEQGIVLRSYPFGEADRVVVLLSPNHGKVRAVAKGVRKTKSRFGGRMETFNHVDLVLYEGRNLATITQAAVIHPFAALRSDLDRVLMAGAMVEAVDAVAQEDESSTRLFLLLQRGLQALERGACGPDLLTAFLLRVAEAVGVAPALAACASCGREEGLDRFSFYGGGVMCDNCRGDGGVRLRAGITEHLAALAAADLANLPTADPALSSEGLSVARRFLEHHLDRRLVAIGVLDE